MCIEITTDKVWKKYWYCLLSSRVEFLIIKDFLARSFYLLKYLCKKNSGREPANMGILRDVILSANHILDFVQLHS